MYRVDRKSITDLLERHLDSCCKGCKAMQDVYDSIVLGLSEDIIYTELPCLFDYTGENTWPSPWYGLCDSNASERN